MLLEEWEKGAKDRRRLEELVFRAEPVANFISWPSSRLWKQVTQAEREQLALDKI